MAGPLVRMSPAAQYELPAGMTPLNLQWENGLQLAGYRLYQTDFRGGYVIPVTLSFRAGNALAQDYSLSVRLFDEAGTQLWAADRAHLALGMHPATWLPGEVVSEYIEVPFPPALPAGRYHLGVMFYTRTAAGGWQNLQLAGAAGEVAFLPPLDVAARR